MRINELNEQTYKYKVPLTEAISYNLWESAGRKLTEANLSQQQIDRLFQQIEQGVTAGGSNRTWIGQGKDAVSAVNQAWEDLKSKMQNSGPVQNFDKKVSDVLSKIGMGSNDPQFEGQVSSWVQKYRDFAKKHPIAQGAIYATLIALAGLSGAGIGGAAALGLLKMSDKLLQGERFTSAAYSGAKTGALAYGANQLGQYIKGQGTGGAAGSNLNPNAGATQDISGSAADAASSGTSRLDAIINNAQDYKVKPGDTLSDILANNKLNPKAFAQLPGNETFFGPGGNPNILKAGQIIKLPNPADIPDLNRMTYTTPDPANFNWADKQYDTTGYHGVYNTNNDITSLSAANNLKMQNLPQGHGLGPGWGSDKGMAAARVAKDLAKNKAGIKESVNLSESNIYLIIGKVVETQNLNEGIMDTLKGAGSKAMTWARTKGHNLTTKVTADKLLQAWKKAGSPTDSVDLAQILQGAGVAPDVIKNVYRRMRIPMTRRTTTPKAVPQAVPPKAVPKSPRGTPSPTANPFGDMARQLTNRTSAPSPASSTSSTGGTTTTTSAGLVHTKNPTRSNTAAANPAAAAFGNMASQLTSNPTSTSTTGGPKGTAKKTPARRKSTKTTSSSAAPATGNSEIRAFSRGEPTKAEMHSTNAILSAITTIKNPTLLNKIKSMFDQYYTSFKV